MVVLGISGKRRDAAAALAVDGRLVAAATEEALSRVPRVGYAQTGGFPRAATEACLKRAGLTLDQVGAIAVAEDEAPAGPDPVVGDEPPSSSPMLMAGAADDAWRSAVTRVDPVWAHAVHAAAASEADPAVVLVIDFQPTGGGIFLSRDGMLAPCRPIGGLGGLMCAARRVARALGHEMESPWEILEDLASLGEGDPSNDFAGVLTLNPPSSFAVDEERLSRLIERAQDGLPGPLSDGGSANVHVQQRRRALAAGFHARLAELVAQLAADLCEGAKARAVAASGSLFASRPLNTRVRHALGGGFSVAPVPEAAGRAVGAALADSGRTGDLPAIGLGPEFTEAAIKQALENCRLDYVYEPDWQRLLGRVSKLLAGGKLVAWFQGPMDFGPRSLGARSILCDPSNRYARENVTRFLKQTADHEPLPVSLSGEAAAECLAGAVRSPFMLFEATVLERWRHVLRAALDHRHCLPVHTVSREQAPELWDLLELHRRKTGVPGLINTTLSAPGEPTACSPRDAIRTTFSSAVDALVMSRFLVMKDYWLLRSDGD